jgi:hypothetical protein
MGLDATMWRDGYGSIPLNASFFGKPRLYRFSGAPPVAAVCAAGFAAGGVYLGEATSTDGNGNPITVAQAIGYPALRGRPVTVEAGATITAGQNLQSDSASRIVPLSSGAIVARALESGGERVRPLVRDRLSSATR